MTKEKFSCRFCSFTTSKWKEAEEHFLLRHKKKQEKQKKKIKEENENLKIKNKIKNTKKRKPKVFKRTENYLLMKKREIFLKRKATIAEKFLKKQFYSVFGKNSFFFQYGFFFSKKDKFYIADFFFPKKNLIIEIDGEYHQKEEQKEKDVYREHNLKKAFNVKILRYPNKKCFDNLFSILKDIEDIEIGRASCRERV